MIELAPLGAEALGQGLLPAWLGPTLASRLLCSVANWLEESWGFRAKVANYPLIGPATASRAGAFRSDSAAMTTREGHP